MRWSLIERAGDASKVHIRTGLSVRESGNGASASQLAGLLPPSASTHEAFAVMTAHHTPEQFLSTLALSGVFERHPDLRIGVFECTSFWIGPWLQRLDALEAAIGRTPREGEGLSACVKRALRVTPLYGEPFVQHMSLHGLEEMFVFGSDFPHPEGGGPATAGVREAGERKGRVARKGADLERRRNLSGSKLGLVCWTVRSSTSIVASCSVSNDPSRVSPSRSPRSYCVSQS
jgi:hypothetical protein